MQLFCNNFASRESCSALTDCVVVPCAAAKRCTLSASPATGLVGMKENSFLVDFFGCLGFLPLTTQRYNSGAGVLYGSCSREESGYEKVRLLSELGELTSSLSVEHYTNFHTVGFSRLPPPHDNRGWVQFTGARRRSACVQGETQSQALHERVGRIPRPAVQRMTHARFSLSQPHPRNCGEDHAEPPFSTAIKLRG